LESELNFRPKIDELYRLPTVMGLAQSYEKHLLQSRMPREGVEASIERTPESVLASFSLIVDPEEREAFKNKEPGLRRGDGEKPCIELPMTNPDDILKKKYAERRSYRQFSPDPIPFARLSELLGYLYQIKLDGRPKYLYGSAGGLYPVQTYLYIKPGRVEELAAGIYYYHPVGHRLVLLSSHVDFDRGVYDPIINGPIFDDAAFGVFLIAQLSAISPMYGARSMHYATIEAGLMTQLLETSAPACGIGLCQIGNLDFKRIQHLFELDQSHVLVHSLLGGLIDIHKNTHWSPLKEAHGHEPAAAGEREEGEI
jgi:pyochelin synthetase